MKNVTLILALSLCLACNNHKQNKDTSQVKESDHTRQEETHEKQGAANEYMHKSPVKDLIDRFESPERDTYQQPQKVLDYLGDL
ncbi:MAG: SAM-dependent methyltransferase, partial [Flavobacteriaceae bacterium]